MSQGDPTQTFVMLGSYTNLQTQHAKEYRHERSI
jgi:hypothetical protein